ncbi:hypothetical protein B0H10DRAFT_1327431 [Mycena sp. CBHHK59/15]|nr:hypothetical protein B0H10DRAFT_1327431 [Mycena sp. CBHHK59/15]
MVPMDPVWIECDAMVCFIHLSSPFLVPSLPSFPLRISVLLYIYASATRCPASSIPGGRPPVGRLLVLPIHTLLLDFSTSHISSFSLRCTYAYNYLPSRCHPSTSTYTFLFLLFRDDSLRLIITYLAANLHLPLLMSSPWLLTFSACQSLSLGLAPSHITHSPLPSRVFPSLTTPQTLLILPGSFAGWATVQGPTSPCAAK